MRLEQSVLREHLRMEEINNREMYNPDILPMDWE